MKRYLTFSFITILIIAVVFTAWYLKFRERQQNSAAVSETSLTKTSLPQHKDFHVVAHFIGKVKAKNKVAITTLEAGTISSVDVADESFVKKGDIIFTLGGARINASVAAIKQKIESLKEQQSLTKAAVSRKQQAVKDKIASFDELDKAKVALAVLNIQLEEAIGQLQILEDAIYIKSPTAGVFSNRRVNAGQNVEKTDMLAEIINPNDLRVEATLFPPEDAQLYGRTANIHTAGGKIISGIVSSVLPQQTSVGGTVIWIESDDINKKVKPGEVVSGDILLATHKKALALPEKTIVRDEQEKTYVFVKRADSYIKQQVQTGLSSDGRVEILSGLTKSDEVVTEGAYELFFQDFNKVYKVAD